MASIKAQPDSPNSPLHQFARELVAESDRGAALLAASALDEQLVVILQTFLVDVKETKELLGIGGQGNAAVGTFSARIKLAYALGLITTKEYQDCNLIRGVRNEFAHKFEMQFSFAQEKVAKRLLNFQLVHADHREEYKNEPRRLFLQGVVEVYQRWTTRHFLVEDKKLQAQNWDRTMWFVLPVDKYIKAAVSQSDKSESK